MDPPPSLSKPLNSLLTLFQSRPRRSSSSMEVRSPLSSSVTPIFKEIPGCEEHVYRVRSASISLDPLDFGYLVKGPETDAVRGQNSRALPAMPGTTRAHWFALLDDNFEDDSAGLNTLVGSYSRGVTRGAHPSGETRDQTELLPLAPGRRPLLLAPPRRALGPPPSEGKDLENSNRAESLLRTVAAGSNAPAAATQNQTESRPLAPVKRPLLPAPTRRVLAVSPMVGTSTTRRFMHQRTQFQLNQLNRVPSIELGSPTSTTLEVI